MVRPLTYALTRPLTYTLTYLLTLLLTLTYSLISIIYYYYGRKMLLFIYSLLRAVIFHLKHRCIVHSQ